MRPEILKEIATELDRATTEVRFVRLSKTALAPKYATDGSAGLDLFANGDGLILGGERALIPCGIAMSIPAGFVGLICPRSGLALKHGITCLNTPGILDCDYRGEIHALLYNSSFNPFQVRIGDRIAQMVITPYERVELDERENLDDTARGAGGFGSTGTR